MAEILATLDDINAELDGQVIKADDANTALLQVSVSRVVRGYLSRIIPLATLASWTDPAGTPEIVRTIAGKLIASQLYLHEIAKTAFSVDDDHFAQRMYDQAIGLLDKLIAGEILLVEVPIGATASMDELDFFPVDDADRAFTMGMEL